MRLLCVFAGEPIQSNIKCRFLGKSHLCKRPCSKVDSHFCCNCLENIPSAEAKFKKNRCNKCFDCPSCQHSLSSRANTVQVVATSRKSSAGGDGTEELPAATSASTKTKEAKPTARKMYYLMCLACRWTSRDVGIPDQTVATGQWPDLEYAHANRFSMLQEHYQNVVLHEKQEKQDFWRRKAPKPHKYPSLTVCCINNNNNYSYKFRAHTTCVILFTGSHRSNGFHGSANVGLVR